MNSYDSTTAIAEQHRAALECQARHHRLGGQARAARAAGTGSHHRSEPDRWWLLRWFSRSPCPAG
jgi:hypothetical protein